MDTKTIYFIGIIIATMLIFLALRSVSTWYWKIDENLNNQKKIIDLLEEIKNQKSI